MLLAIPLGLVLYFTSTKPHMRGSDKLSSEGWKEGNFLKKFHCKHRRAAKTERREESSSERRVVVSKREKPIARTRDSHLHGPILLCCLGQNSKKQKNNHIGLVLLNVLPGRAMRWQAAVKFEIGKFLFLVLSGDAQSGFTPLQDSNKWLWRGA